LGLEAFLEKRISRQAISIFFSNPVFKGKASWTKASDLNHQAGGF